MIALLVLATSLLSSLEEGWIPVERVKPAPQVEIDPDEWIYFTKQMKGENFLVKLPSDPEYRYRQDGGLEIVSRSGDTSYLLTITPLEGEGKRKSRYLGKGNWQRATVVETERYRYSFQTIGEAEFHGEMVASLDIEKQTFLL